LKKTYFSCFSSPGSAERETPTDDASDMTSTPPSESQVPDSSSVTNDVSFKQLDEDWDSELRNELYQDALDTCIERNNLNSILIDSFQNKANRYPPCFHAYSPTACYDSLVYKSADKSFKVGILQQEEGQFEDAEF